MSTWLLRHAVVLMLLLIADGRGIRQLQALENPAAAAVATTTEASVLAEPQAALPDTVAPTAEASVLAEPPAALPDTAYGQSQSQLSAAAVEDLAPDYAAAVGQLPHEGTYDHLYPVQPTVVPVFSAGMTPVQRADGVVHTKHIHMVKQSYAPIGSIVAAGKKPPPSPSPAPEPLCSPPGYTGCIGISLHGGTIMNTGLTLFPIFYGSRWTAAQMGIIFRFLSGLGGSAWMNISALYSDSVNGFYPNNRGLFNSSAPQAYASLPTGTYGLTTQLSDTDIFTLVQWTVANRAAPLSTKVLYLVLTDDAVKLTSGFCTPGSYCGWHTWDYYPGTTTALKYAFIGNAGSQCPSACIATNVRDATPNGDAGVDGMINVMAHEITEALSDPYLTIGWLDAQGKENADKCAWTFGQVYTANGAFYNMVDANNNKFYVQQNWNMRTGACVMTA